MPYSASKCQDLAARIAKTEASLDNYLNGERVLNIQDGPESVNFQAGTGIEAGLRRRLYELQRKYQSGGCAVVLGNDDVDAPQSRKAIKPIFGHR